MVTFVNQKYFACIILFLFTLTSCQKVQSSHQRLASLPQDPLIQVYFNHAESSEYKEAYRQKTRLGDDLEQKIIDAITEAKSTIEVAVQELRLPRIAQALANKQKSGVKVRLILEHNYVRPWSSLTREEVKLLNSRDESRYHEFGHFADINQDHQISQGEIQQRDGLVIIQNAQVPWIDNNISGSKKSHLMHHKFVIIDNHQLIITSANFTLRDTSGEFSDPNSLGNANNLLRIESPELANLFTQEFNLMWGKGRESKSESKFGVEKPMRSPQAIMVGNSKVTVHFSPTPPIQPWSQSSNGLIGETLAQGTKSIDLALFVFSEPKLAQVLEKRHQENVQVRALIEPEFAYRPYSEAWDMTGVTLSNHCKSPSGHSWQNPMTTFGVPILPKGDLLHHKFAVIDQQKVITGSHNWSEAANYSNDETLVVIENPVVAAHYQREFNRLYTKARLGIPAKRIKATSKKCHAK